MSRLSRLSRLCRLRHPLLRVFPALLPNTSPERTPTTSLHPLQRWHREYLQLQPATLMEPIAQQYYLDSRHTHDTVTHTTPGIDGASQGTWLTETKLPSGNEESVVFVQRLVSSDGHHTIPKNQPRVMRAVKRFIWYRQYPERDYRPTIARGILCMARANVSDTIAVVRMLGWYEDEQYIYIAMEYYHQGNLRDFVLNSPLQSETWSREVIRQILGVLVELTASQLTHRNITPSNILIATTLPIRVKLGDFHNAKFLFEDDGLRTQVGTLPYIAPEMRGLLNNDHKLSHSYDTKVDMWALGIILHEMLTKMHPFRECGRPRFSEREYQRFLRQHKPVSLSALEGKASIHAMSFVAWMLARDPNLRPTPEQALCAPWFMHPILPV